MLTKTALVEFLRLVLPTTYDQLQATPSLMMADNDTSSFPLFRNIYTGDLSPNLSHCHSPLCKTVCFGLSSYLPLACGNQKSCTENQNYYCQENNLFEHARNTHTHSHTHKPSQNAKEKGLWHTRNYIHTLYSLSHLIRPAFFIYIYGRQWKAAGPIQLYHCHY